MQNNATTPEEGQPVRVDSARSREFASIIAAEKQQCYRNAAMTLLVLHDRTPADGAYLPDGTVYIEGWVLIKYDIPIEHAWLQTSDGTIYDPTLVLLNSDEEMAALRYITAKSWTADEVHEHAVIRGGTLPILGSSGFAFMGSDWWQEAHRRMMRLAYPDTGEPA